MKSSPSQHPGQTSFICPDLIDQLNPKHPLLALADKIPWLELEESLTGKPNGLLFQKHGQTGKTYPSHGRLVDTETDRKFK